MTLPVGQIALRWTNDGHMLDTQQRRNYNVIYHDRRAKIKTTTVHPIHFNFAFTFNF
jgi:hypothetical protein